MSGETKLRIADAPRYHRPHDILSHAIAMPDCDDYSQARSLYAESFLSNRVSRYHRKPNASLVHTPFSDARSTTGKSSYQASFAPSAAPAPALKSVPLAELQVERLPFDATSTNRASYSSPPPVARVTATNQSRTAAPCLPFTATSLSRDSYRLTACQSAIAQAVNPERERDAQAAVSRLSPAYHHFGMTSTNKGDFVVAAKDGSRSHSSCEVIRQKSPACTKVIKQLQCAPRDSGGVPAGKPLSRLAHSKVIGGSFVEPIQSISRASYTPVTFV